MGGVAISGLNQNEFNAFHCIPSESPVFVFLYSRNTVFFVVFLFGLIWYFFDDARPDPRKNSGVPCRGEPWLPEKRRVPLNIEFRPKWMPKSNSTQKFRVSHLGAMDSIAPLRVSNRGGLAPQAVFWSCILSAPVEVQPWRS